MTKKLGVCLVMLLSLGLGGCGDDDGGGEEGGGSSGNGGGSGSGASAGRGSSPVTGSTADRIAMCMMMDTGETADCEGIEEYTECVQTACAEEYELCLGPDYMDGDFSGGMCESLAECTEDSADPCSCSPDQACLNCFVNNFVSCATSCPLPNCGGATGGAGTGGLPMTDKTCDDLADCCASIDDDTAKSTCMQVLQGAMAAGDFACGLAYTNFTMFGCE